MRDNIPYDARVLVAVINRPKDLERARNEGWYRVPLKRAPCGLAADYLAFYQTAAFQAERWAVRYVAPVLRVDVVPRRALLPEEPDHPRANERYYRFVLGPLWSLPVPVPSRRLRRVSFIPTTLGQLLRARDVVELWHPLENNVTSTEVWAGGVNRR